VAGKRSIFAAGHIDWNEGQIRILLAGPTGEMSADIQRRARAVQKRAQRGAPVRTGELRSSIGVNTRYPSEGAVAEITASAPYSLVVEFGRGRVTPKSGMWLHWQGDIAEVFAKEAAAVPATNFMVDALDAFDE
jgi:hypothetical protein